jgi:hypothetical protein
MPQLRHRRQSNLALPNPPFGAFEQPHEVGAMSMHDDGSGRDCPSGTSGSSSAIVMPASVMVAAREPTEMNRVIHTPMTNTRQAARRADGLKTANTPAAVATPLPPRKRNHTG